MDLTFAYLAFCCSLYLSTEYVVSDCFCSIIFYLFYFAYCTKKVRYIKIFILQSQKRRRHLSKIAFELIRAQAERAILKITKLFYARLEYHQWLLVIRLLGSAGANKTEFSGLLIWIKRKKKLHFYNPSNMCLRSDIYHCFLLTMASAKHGDRNSKKRPSQEAKRLKSLLCAFSMNLNRTCNSAYIYLTKGKLFLRKIFENSHLSLKERMSITEARTN